MDLKYEKRGCEINKDNIFYFCFYNFCLPHGYINSGKFHNLDFVWNKQRKEITNFRLGIKIGTIWN